MSLHVSYQKEQEYIWFRGGDLNSFLDIRPCIKHRGGAYPSGIPGQCHWMCCIIRNKNMYGLGGGDLNGF